MPTATETSNIPGNTVEVIVALAVALAVAGALAIVAGGLMRRFLVKIEGDRAHVHPVSNATVRAVRILTFILALALVAIPALNFAGMDMAVGLQGQDLLNWMGRTGLRIGIILLLATAGNRLASALIGQAQREMVTGSTLADREHQKRALTIGNTFNRFLSIVIWAIGLLMILQTLDVNIMPVLTGAGILGLAVGFGAQTLVKDVIAGFFILVEDQVRVGDVAVVNGTGGSVEQINLRTIVLRDAEGIVYVIPNGEIKTLANRSKDFSYYVLDVGIDYDDDIDAAVAAVEDAAADLQRDAAFAPDILEPLEVMGVDDFQASSVTLKFRIKTVPLRQWAVGRELRKRVKLLFDARGIRIPYQQIAVTIRKDGVDAGLSAGRPASARPDA